MRIMIVPDDHYYKMEDGKIYAKSVHSYDFFKRYLQVFDYIYVVARISNIQKINVNYIRANGERVEFLQLPESKGILQFFKKYLIFKKLSKKYCSMFDCAIFRVPSVTGNLLCKDFMKLNRPFCLEVVVDPYLCANWKINTNIFNIVACLQWTIFLKRACLTANGVAYVTKKYLQQRYPSKALKEKNNKQYFTSNYSSVMLRDEQFGSPKLYNNKKTFLISHVSNSFTGYRKGHLTLIRALKIVRDKGYSVEVVFVGDGVLKEKFIHFADKYGVSKYTRFTGKLANSNEVTKVLIKSDLFVLPTSAEGLPRVLLEAMAVGLPCLSTPVCGIPEILDNEYLVPYDDYNQFANKIIELINNPKRLEEISKHNIQVALEYSEKKLNIKRKEFYQKLKNIIN